MDRQVSGESPYRFLAFGNGSRIAKDEGFESPEEISAVKEIEAYANSTGPFGGGTVVRAYGAAKDEITVWLNPHGDAPVKIVVTQGRTVFTHTNDIDAYVPDNRWNRLGDPTDERSQSHLHADAVDRIVRRVFASQLAASRKTSEAN